MTSLRGKASATRSVRMIRSGKRNRGPQVPTEIQPIEPKFWSKVQKTETCWLWGGTVNPITGYGYIIVDRRKNRKNISVHRLSYELHKGKIPKGLCVCHTCDNRRCVNPDHLWLGSVGDNIKDAVRKERHARGERIHCAKLSATDVREMRRLFSKGFKGPEISDLFGVAPCTVYRVLHGETWNHVHG